MWSDGCGEAAGFGEWQSGSDTEVPCGFVDGDDGGAGFGSGKDGFKEQEIFGGVRFDWLESGGRVGQWRMECDGFLSEVVVDIVFVSVVVGVIVWVVCGVWRLCAGAELVCLDGPVGEPQAEVALGFHAGGVLESSAFAGGEFFEPEDEVEVSAFVKFLKVGLPTW